jgi:hypothetical protein
MAVASFGGYSTWSPVAKTLTPAPRKEVADLEARLRTLRAAQHKLFKEASKEAGGDLGKLNRLYQDVVKSEEFHKLSRQLSAAFLPLEELRPQPRCEAFVWLCRRKTMRTRRTLTQIDRRTPGQSPLNAV